MREAAAAPIPAVLRAIFIGLAVGAAGVLPWVAFARLNIAFHPEFPWAGAATLVFLAVYLAWLNGFGPPRSTSEFRKRSLRLRRPAGDAWRGEHLAGTLGIIGLIAAMYLLWILIPAPRMLALAHHYTTVTRVTFLIAAAIVAGVTEEAAFRGYMQTQLERFGAEFAIVTTSIVFALVHVTHGIQTVLVLGPGLFITSVLYGMLAVRVASIVPGIVLHTLGDGMYGLFVALG